MKKLFSLLLVCLLAFPSASRAQKLPSAIAKGLLVSPAKTAALNGWAARNISAAQMGHLRALSKTNFEELDDMLEGYFELNPSFASREQLLQNERMQEEAVLNWLERDTYAALHREVLQKNFSVKPVSGRIDYVSYIPYDARLVMLGEVHEQDWIVSEVEQAVMQFRRSHPDRNVYYASEFVDASAQGIYILSSEKDVERLVRKRPYYRGITERLVRAGVRVVGLESPALSAELVKTGYLVNFANPELEWKTISPSAMRDRNTYWARIIRRIYEQDPDAAVFVHAGFGHTDYNHPASLPWLLKKFNPFVVEFSASGNGDFNTLLERNVPISSAAYAEGWALSAREPGKPIRFIRHMHRKRVAVITGCDLSIKLVPGMKQ